MIRFRLSEIASKLDARVVGDDVVFNAISTDTRQIKDGDLFVAIRGDNFDGHEYLDTAQSKNAVAALVDHELNKDLPQLVVADTRIGLGQLAAAWRQKSKAVVVAVTGSNGKTTLKELIASILSTQDSVLATQGNLNNDIGLPITLTRLQDEAFAVVELGANHPGEIDYLSNIAAPDVAVLNNAGRAHLEGFGSLDGVAKAKLEITQGLSKNGVFIYNADDCYAPMWRDASLGFNCLTFGMEKKADIASAAESSAIDWQDGKATNNFKVITPIGEFVVCLSLLGKHNQMNALAAIAVAVALNIDVNKIIKGLALVQPVKGRLFPVKGNNNCRLIDDSYNANPDSVIAAINVLKDIEGRKTLILGDLAELGADNQYAYQELGRVASEAGLDRVLTVGSASKATSDSFGVAGQHFNGKKVLLDSIQNELTANDVILVKGSRSASMETVVAGLTLGALSC